MPYAYNIQAVLDILRAFVIANLTTQGETPTAIPYMFTIGQYKFDPNLMPVTIFEVKSIPIGRDSGANTICFEVPVIIHHVRKRVASSNAEMVGLARIVGIATAIETDFRVNSVTGASAIPISTVEPVAILIGDDNPLQQMLNMALQNVSVAVVSMSVKITWYEGNH